MKKRPTAGLMEMWLGAVLGALIGVFFVSAPWPENSPLVGALCLVGLFLGLIVGRIRRGMQSWDYEVLPPVDAADQKTLVLNTLADARFAYREIIVHSVASARELDAADQDFADNAFAPFWDHIERAANELAAYKNSIEQMGRCIHLYQREALQLQDTPGAVPVLHLPDHKLPDARPQVERFTALVRRAQTNFQFAMIYEQRKTNQLLHAGFGTLGAAIYSLGESVNLSLTALSKTMNRGLDNLLVTSFAQMDFQHEIKDRLKDSKEALDRTYLGGRIDG